MADGRTPLDDLEKAKTAVQLLEKQRQLSKEAYEFNLKKNKEEQKSLSFAQKKVNFLESEIKLAEENLEYIKGGEEALKRSIESLQIELQSTTKTKEELHEINLEILRKNEYLRIGADAIREENEALITQLETQVDIEAVAGNITKEIQAALGATEEWRKGWIGTLADATDKSLSFLDILKKIGENVTSNEFQGSMFAATMEKSHQILMAVTASTTSMAVAIDKVQSSVMLSTGEFGRYDSMINEIRVSQLHMAVTAEQVGEAITNLYQTVRAFSLLSVSAQEDLTRFTTTMEAMGVSGEATAGALQVSMAVLGQTKEQAITTQKELLGVAKALKETPETLVKGFAESSSALAKHGDKMLGVFSRLSAAAKALQTDVSVLTGAFGTQMDTFEGAAMSSAKINQLLGGQYIDAMKLMHADEEQRVRMVLEGIEKSGQRADLLGNKFGRLAFASAAGISNVADANKILQMGLGGYDQMISKSKAVAVTQKEMEEKATKAVDIMKKLAAAMQSLAISMEPVVDFAKSVIDTFIDWNKETDGYLIPTLAGLVGIMSAIGVYTKSIAILQAARILKTGSEVTATQTLVGMKKAEATARNQNASAMQREATAAKNQAAAGTAGAGTATMMMAKAKAAMAYGAALLFVGAGFAAIAGGVWLLADAVK